MNRIRLAADPDISGSESGKRTVIGLPFSPGLSPPAIRRSTPNLSGSSRRFFSKMTETSWRISFSVFRHTDRFGATSPNFSSMTFSRARYSSRVSSKVRAEVLIPGALGNRHSPVEHVEGDVTLCQIGVVGLLLGGIDFAVRRPHNSPRNRLVARPANRSGCSPDPHPRGP